MSIDDVRHNLVAETALARAAMEDAAADLRLAATAVKTDASEANMAALADAEYRLKEARLNLENVRKLDQAARTLPASPDDVDSEQTDYASRLPSIVGMGVYLLVVTLLSIVLLASLMMAENPATVINMVGGKEQEQITCGKQVVNVVRENNPNSPPTARPAAQTNANANTGTAATNSNSVSAPNRSVNITVTTANNANAANTATNANANTNTNTNTNTTVAINSSSAASPANSVAANTTATNSPTANSNIAIPSPATIAPVNPKVAIAKQLCVESFGFIADSRFFAADSYLFLVVLFAGMMGGAVRGMSSFFRHLGYGDFSFKWAWYYILLPFSGATLGIVIYLVLRGGFYGGSFDEGLNLNVFSFAALAAVTGLFSENALEKLRQVAVTLLAEVPPKVQNAKEIVQAKTTDKNKP